MIHNTRFIPASSGRCTVHDPQTQPNVGTCVVFTVKYFTANVGTCVVFTVKYFTANVGTCVVFTAKYFTANVGTWVVFTVHCADEVGVVFSST